MSVLVRNRRSKKVQRFTAQDQRVEKGSHSDSDVFGLLTVEFDQQLVVDQFERLLDEASLRFGVDPEYVEGNFRFSPRWKWYAQGAARKFTEAY